MRLCALPVLADMGWDHMDGGWWVVMMIGMGLFWVLVLDRRLAEGSISADEHKERREILEESNR